jgi:hypothetical protein
MEIVSKTRHYREDLIVILQGKLMFVNLDKQVLQFQFRIPQLYNVTVNYKFSLFY